MRRLSFLLNRPIHTASVGLVCLAKSLLSAQDRRLLLETQSLLEELLETEDILRDKRLMKSIAESQNDVKRGRVYTIEQAKRILRAEGKL